MLQGAVRSHVASFNMMLEHTLPEIPAGIPHQELLVKGRRVRFWLDTVTVAKPAVGRRTAAGLAHTLLPAECRERRVTYKADAHLRLMCQVDELEPWTVDRVIGQVRLASVPPVRPGLLLMLVAAGLSTRLTLVKAPIMVKSSRCHLHGRPPKDLVTMGEEREEMGGYFIVNGNEKIIRVLIMPRRNYVGTFEKQTLAC